MTPRLLPHAKLRWIALILVIVPVLSALAGCSAPGTMPGGTDLKMAPIGGMPGSIQQAPTSVREAYQFAVANPDALRNVPCYCGCGAAGHTSNTIQMTAGQPLHLRLTSDDVMHGFAIGKSAQPAIDIPPGEVVETTLLFDKPGTYTFYCAAWCGPNYWRMRGTIEVTGPGPTPTQQPQPLFLKLGMDVDMVSPPDFTDPKNLLGASPALLEGKMIRGGMGTGMPYWGPIFTQEQLDELVSYIYTFVLK